MNGLVTNALDHATLSCHESRSASAGFQVSPENRTSVPPRLDINSERDPSYWDNVGNCHKSDRQNESNMPKVLGNKGIRLRDSFSARASTSGPHASIIPMGPVTYGCETISRHATA